MAAIKARNPSSRHPRDLHGSPASHNISRTPRSKKGKGKEDDRAAPPTKLYACNDSREIGEDSTWSWTSLTDSSASRHTPIFTKDGSYFFSITGSSVKIYSVLTGQVVSTLSSLPYGSSSSRSSGGDGHTDLITSAILSPHNPFQLITGSLDGCIKVWDFLEAVLLQTIDIAQPILHLCAHEKFKDHLYIAVSRPVKKSKGKGNIKADDSGVVLQVSIKPGNATAVSGTRKSSEVITVGKTRSTSGLALSPNGDWLVAIAGHKAYVARTSSVKTGFTKFVSPQRLSCLAFHPSEDYFATGDDKGTIRLWYCLNEQMILTQSIAGMEKKAQTTTLHWHAHAVSSLAFTANGAYLLSGGEEAVLVIWQLHTGKKEFIPRVGSPILSIAVSRPRARNEEYLLGLADASFVFIDAGALSIVRSFSRIKLDSTASLQSSSTSAFVPLAFHIPTSALVLPASHPSSLQTYSPSQSKLLSELEVSPSNRVSRRDEKPIEPSRVQLVAVSPKGEWMATIDGREGDDAFRGEVYLKIWWWDPHAGIWTLNTRIDRPHGLKKIIHVSFSPAETYSNPLLLATVGGDEKVKIWGLRSTTSRNGDKDDFWIARSTFGFRSEVPTHVSWSLDGSLLAASFGPYVTLCDPLTSVTHQVMTSPECKSVLSAHFIGREGRYLAVIGMYDLIMWDLILQTIQWHHRSSSPIDRVIPHPRDDSLALFYRCIPSEAASSRISIFRPVSSMPLRLRTLPFCLLNVVPYPASPNSPSGTTTFSFVGVTATWSVVLFGDVLPSLGEVGSNAQAIAAGTDVGQKRTLFQDIFGKSAFADLLNEQSSSIALPVMDHRQPWTGKEVAKMLDGPTHLMPPVQTMFDSLMGGFLQLRQTAVQNAPNDNGEKEELLDADVVMEMDVVDADAPLMIRHASERVVDRQEMDMFVELFKQNAVTRDSSTRPHVNGHKSNGSHASNNGYASSHNSFTTSPASVLKTNGTTQSKIMAASHLKSVVNGRDSSSFASSTPATTGKKRKKSLE